MRNVQLVTLDPSVSQALAKDAEYMDALIHDNWPRVAEIVHRVVGRTLNYPPATVDTLHWGGYIILDEDTREVIGSCAFKTPPTDQGSVEIAYFTFPGFEGQGYATAAARKLVELATRSPAVQQVIAHTLPEDNASTHVLKKLGMLYVGEVMDPDDGRVWRWQLALVDRSVSTHADER